MMLKRKITSCLLLVLMALGNAQQKDNPKNICKSCGSFDLKKITFSEKISDLTAKTQFTKSMIVNHKNELKYEEEVSKNDTVKLYKYDFANGSSLILGKNYFNYNGQFNFNNLEILTDAKGRMAAIESTIFYEGKFDDVTKFIVALKNSFRGFKLIKSRMHGDLDVYQWFTDDQIIQLVNSKEGMEERTIDGKTTQVKSTYVKLNLYTRNFIEKSFGKIVERDLNFALFDDRYFIKP